MSAYSAKVIARFWSKVDKSADPDGAGCGLDTLINWGMAFLVWRMKLYEKPIGFLGRCNLGLFQKACMSCTPPRVSHETVYDISIWEHRSKIWLTAVFCSAAPPLMGYPMEGINIPEAMIATLREHHATGVSRPELARMYGIPLPTVHNIILVRVGNICPLRQLLPVSIIIRAILATKYRRSVLTLPLANSLWLLWPRNIGCPIVRLGKSFAVRVGYHLNGLIWIGQRCAHIPLLKSLRLQPPDALCPDAAPAKTPPPGGLPTVA